MSCLEKGPQPLSLLFGIPSGYMLANNLVRKITTAKIVFHNRKMRNDEFSFGPAGFETLADIT